MTGKHAAPVAPKEIARQDFPYALVALGLGVLLLLLGAVIGRSTAPEAEAAGKLTPKITKTTPPAPASTTVTATPDPVDAALSVSPLSKLAPGDRVIFNEKVCKFVLWSGSIAAAKIKCPGDDAFEVQTGYLTPVEPK